MTRRLPLSEIHTIHLDATSQEPLYRQLYSAIRQAILSGRFPSKVRLPSSRQFADTLAIARNTVTAAYDQLVDEGFIERRPGSGSFVAETQPDTFIHVDSIPKRAPAIAQKSPLSQRGKRMAAPLRHRATGTPKPFVPGLPDLGELPIERWSRLMAKHWRLATPSMLAYGNTGGLPALRHSISAYLNACRAVNCQPKQVIVVAGAQQALDLTCRLLLDDGDPAWIEEPGYGGARGALINSGAKLIPVPLDAEGLDLTRGKALCSRPKLIYITPSHQYPTGRTMSLRRRLALLEMARETGAWIIEDDYDSEYRYSGKPLAALQGLDQSNRVLYIGTFSKVLFPSLRMGYLVVPPALTEAFLGARGYTDTQPPVVIQAALAELMDSGHFLSHIRRMRALYASRQQLMIGLLRQHLHPWLFAEPPLAGMQLAAEAIVPMDDVAISRRAERMGLHLPPLSTYYSGTPQTRGFVLGYAGFREEELRRGVEALASLLACN